jgi:hypothetical protein
VSQLLRSVRNAGHGLGRGPRNRKDLLELMGHRGQLSPNLPDLAWLHLMRLMCSGGWDPFRRIATAEHLR